MKNVCNNPLLLQGFRMSGSAAVVAANTVVNQKATIEQQRGNVKYLDVLSMIAPGALTNAKALVNVQTGGDDLLQNIPASMFNPEAYTKAYNLVCVDMEAGQTVNWTFDNSNNANDTNATLHLYYENPFLLDEKFLAKFDEKARGLKERVYSYAVAGGVKSGTSQKQQLPSSQGNIIGVQLFAENGAGVIADIYKAFVTVLINGEQVILNANLGLGWQGTSRPYMRFPISVPKSGTFEIQIDNGDSATQNIYGLKFFFDQE